MTKKELMMQKTRSILREVKRMESAVATLERELREGELEKPVAKNRFVALCEELHARLEDIRTIVEESQRLVEEPTGEVEELDLWL
jgi:hypothetical protein